jgi:transposase
LDSNSIEQFPDTARRRWHIDVAQPYTTVESVDHILSSNTDALSPRMVNLIAELVQDWRRLDERIAAMSAEIESLAEQDEACQRVMTVPGAGPIISSAVVAAGGRAADGLRSQAWPLRASRRDHAPLPILEPS